MIEKQINSAGTITLPKEVRDAFGISGICTLYVGIEKNSKGEPRIVLSKKNNLDSIVNSFKSLCEILAIVSSCKVALVCNKRVISVSSEDRTVLFIDKNMVLSSVLCRMLSNKDFYGELLKKPVTLFDNTRGAVRVFFDYKLPSGEVLFFIFFKGSGLEYLGSEELTYKVSETFRKVEDILKKYEVVL